jgi:acyl-CoA synthetase (AMP-forming)/AMP-acid ligase II
LSRLDAALAFGVLGTDVVFAIDYSIARRWWARPFLPVRTGDSARPDASARDAHADQHAARRQDDSLRYVLAGAERVKDSTRRTYMNKFGVRILEGYGVTETAPVLAIDTPMYNKSGTVGRLMPGMKSKLEPVPGIDDGGRLFVCGPNVMLGYVRTEKPEVIEPPPEGWQDTGDIVSIDDQGFITVKDRAKRFAKIGGEMVSLTAVEALAAGLWPDIRCVAVNTPDPRKGERIVLLTEKVDLNRADLQAYAKSKGAADLDDPIRDYRRRPAAAARLGEDGLRRRRQARARPHHLGATAGSGLIGDLLAPDADGHLPDNECRRSNF